MNVLQLFTTVDAETVVEEHNKFYKNTPIDLETYAEFVQIIQGKVIVQTGAVVSLNHARYEYDDPNRNYEEFDVTWGIDDKVYSMSFQPWNEIAGAVVKDNSRSLTDAQVAAHLFYEITWYGFEDQTEQKRDELIDTVEEMRRHIDVSTSCESPVESNQSTKVSTFKLFDFEKMKSDGASEEEIENLKKRLERNRAMEATKRVYVNGTLQSRESC